MFYNIKSTSRVQLLKKRINLGEKTPGCIFLDLRGYCLRSIDVLAIKSSKELLLELELLLERRALGVWLLLCLP